MRICSIVGARPQFVKLAMICRAIEAREGWTHRIIHTGQHYDRGLSDVFFDELGFRLPIIIWGSGPARTGNRPARC